MVIILLKGLNSVSNWLPRIQSLKSEREIHTKPFQGVYFFINNFGLTKLNKTILCTAPSIFYHKNGKIR